MDCLISNLNINIYGMERVTVYSQPNRANDNKEGQKQIK